MDLMSGKIIQILKVRSLEDLAYVTFENIEFQDSEHYSMERTVLLIRHRQSDSMISQPEKEVPSPNSKEMLKTCQNTPRFPKLGETNGKKRNNETSCFELDET